MRASQCKAILLHEPMLAESKYLYFLSVMISHSIPSHKLSYLLSAAFFNKCLIVYATNALLIVIVYVMRILMEAYLSIPSMKYLSDGICLPSYVFSPGPGYNKSYFFCSAFMHNLYHSEFGKCREVREEMKTLVISDSERHET